MAVGELFLSAFITVLFEKLASPQFIRLAKSAGISSELKKLESNLTLIRAVLADAAEKQIRDTSVQLWLNQLQHLAYEIDDVLDDLATEAMRSQLDKKSDASTSKVLKYIPNKVHDFKYGRKMSSKLDGITATLHDLIEKINILGLTNKVEMPNRAAASKPREQTSLLPVKDVIGRESDKEALLEKLLGSESSSSQNVSVMSIVGMGGIGKTTLAQLLYNDEKVKNHFELMSWVCISDEFDVFNISKAIFQAVGGGNQDFANLNLLQVALAEKLSKKRFLLVLDDVWNENYDEWERLQRPFTVGAPKSKILVTTRKAIVASMMESVQRYNLELLSDEDALCLFAQHALGEQNFDVNRTLKLHGEDIIKKCGNLPLALRALGRVFRTKSNVEEWEELLNNELWNSQSGSDQILPALRLSYYDLPPHLKQMFVYCCLFPKDYMFESDELVLLWMAEGFLYKLNGNQSMENFGRECFEELVSRSFFQHSTNVKSGYTMHDLVNDLAINVAGEFFIMLDDKMNVYGKNEALEKFHHASFIRAQYEMHTKFNALQRARHLRTSIGMSVRRLGIWDRFYLSDMLLVKLLPQLQFLRVLSLANYRIKEVPESIGGLKHLRYLNFSNTNIACLPEQVGDLHNLQSLLLSGCTHLSSLPDSIVRLIHLRHLDIHDTPKLSKMPLGIGQLTSLQTLSKVFIGEACEFNISDLKGLLHLQGQLCIDRLHKVKNAEQAKEANLQQKKGLCDLQLEWSDVFDGSRNKLTEYEVLEGLRPFERLRSLQILYYNGTKFPSWVGDRSFDCLTQITLTGCRSCKSLPALGHLQSLQKLCVESIHELEKVGSELLGLANSCNGNAFPALEVLKFRDMPNWREWSTSGGQNGRTFPCLSEISLVDCPKLDVVAVDSMLSLRALRVSGCSVAVLKSMVGVSSSLVKLKMCDIQGLTQLQGEVLKHLMAVEYLNISDCGELTYLWESEVAACEILKSLQKLEISGCAELVSLGEKEVHLKSSVESVTEVNIRNCKRLKCYMCPDRIEKWGLQNFPTSLVSLELHGGEKSERVVSFAAKPKEDTSGSSSSFLLPSSLTVLYLWNFKELESISEGLQHLTCLQHLELWSCPKLRDLPETLVPSLSSLGVYGKCSPELKKKCRRNRKGKYWPIISQIPFLTLQLD